MEITKSLRDDIFKIQNELITAIQNHQVGNSTNLAKFSKLSIDIAIYFKRVGKLYLVVKYVF